MYRGRPNAAAAARFRRDNRLTWHHVEGMDGAAPNELILVPMDFHGNIPHAGGASRARSALDTVDAPEDLMSTPDEPAISSDGSDTP